MVASSPTEAQALLEYHAEQLNGLPQETATERKARAAALIRVDVAKQRFESMRGETRPNRLQARQDKFTQSLGELFTIVHQHRLRLASKMPKHGTPKGRASGGTVHCVATLTVDCAPGQAAHPTTQGGEPAGTRTKPRDKTRLSGTNVFDMRLPDFLTGQTGGFVVEGSRATAHAELTAKLVTRSTGDKSPSTHAEARLLEYVEGAMRVDLTWKDRIRIVEIQVSHSPCGSCTDRLVELHKIIANPKLRLSILQWGIRYDKGPSATTSQHIEALRRHYHVAGP